MKKLVITLLFIFPLLCAFQSFAQEADGLVGLWLPSNGKARVQIFKEGDKFSGRIVWLREPNNDEGKPKVDKNNPDAKLQTRRLLGLKLLNDFSYVGKKSWENGTIYDPENGNLYNCVITMTDENTIEVRGFIGVSMFGRTDVWKRMVKATK